MNKTPGVLCVLTVALCLTASSFTTPVFAKSDGERSATLSGCVVAGNEKGSFLLTGTTVDGNIPATVYYRLDKAKGLRNLVGHRVEVRGVADLRDYDTGKLKVKTDDRGKTVTEVKVDGKTVKVEEYLNAGLGAMKVRTDVPTYAFEVKNVKRIDGTCTK